MKEKSVRYAVKVAALHGLFGSCSKQDAGNASPLELLTTCDYIDRVTGEKIKDAMVLLFCSSHRMDVGTESVLLAMVRIAMESGRRHTLTPDFFPSLDDDVLREHLSSVISAATTKYRILKEAGMTDGNENYDLLDERIQALSKITVQCRTSSTKWEAFVHFLPTCQNKDGRIGYTLNWLLTSAIFGECQYANIDLNERHALRTDASKTLHRWLSAHVWAGKKYKQTVRYETMASYIWPSTPVTASTQRGRLFYLKRKVLPELAQLPKWKIRCFDEKVEFSRLGDAPDIPTLKSGGLRSMK